jgi:CrcB protein
MDSTPIAISLGAILGALSRYYITLFWIEKKGSAFPYGTLFVNLTGAIIIGLASIVITQSSQSIALQRLIIVGFLGAYTTFSSYMLDAVKLFRAGRQWRSIIYGVGSPLLGFFCVELGIWLGQQLS